jgi:hypothetical protein
MKNTIELMVQLKYGMMGILIGTLMANVIDIMDHRTHVVFGGYMGRL